MRIANPGPNQDTAANAQSSQVMRSLIGTREWRVRHHPSQRQYCQREPNECRGSSTAPACPYVSMDRQAPTSVRHVRLPYEGSLRSDELSHGKPPISSAPERQSHAITTPARQVEPLRARPK